MKRVRLGLEVVAIFFQAFECGLHLNFLTFWYYEFLKLFSRIFIFGFDVMIYHNGQFTRRSPG